MSKYGDFSGPYFPVFGLNTEVYGVYLLIQCRKMQTRKISVFGHFSHNMWIKYFAEWLMNISKVFFAVFLRMKNVLR